MAVPAPLIEFFLQEHHYRPWSGRLLTLGRQTVMADACRLETLLANHGINWNQQFAQFDRDTVQAKQYAGRNYVNDVTLFSAFGSTHLDVMDITDREGANIIHNPCQPVPEILIGQYDVIFDGGVLDNVFDPAQVLRNISRLLSADGRVIHLEMASDLVVESWVYSTDWFLDYYVVNKFRDCRIYVCTCENEEQLLHGPWRVYAYMPRPDGTPFSLLDLQFKQAVLVVVAEKQSSSTYGTVPRRWSYRDQAQKDAYNRQLATLGVERPIFGFQRSQPPISTQKLGGFVDCGVAGG